MSLKSDLKATFAALMIAGGGAVALDTVTSGQDRVTVDTHSSLPGDGERNGRRILAHCTNADGKKVVIDVTGADDRLEDGKTYDVRTGGALLKTLRSSRMVAGK